MKPPYNVTARRLGGNLYRLSSDQDPDLDGAYTWEEVCLLAAIDDVPAVLVLNQHNRAAGELAFIEYRPTRRTPLAAMARPHAVRESPVTGGSVRLGALGKPRRPGAMKGRPPRKPREGIGRL